MKPVTIDPRYHDAVIFHLDGLVADTAAIHAAAWKTTFDDYLARRPANEHEDHSPFADDDYRRYVHDKPRLDGVADFLASRRVSLPRGEQADTFEETVCGLGNRMQNLFLDLLDAGGARVGVDGRSAAGTRRGRNCDGHLLAESRLSACAARRGHRESVRRACRRS